MRIGKCKTTGDMVALKVLRKKDMSRREMEGVEREIEILQELQGRKGIVELKRVWRG